MQQTKIRPYFLFASLVGAGILSFTVLKPFFTPLLLSIVCAVAVQPIYQWIEHALNRRSKIAAAVTILLVCLFIVGPVIALGFEIFTEALALYGSISSSYHGGLVFSMPSGIAEILHQYFPSLPTSVDLSPSVTRALSWIFSNLAGIFSSIALTFIEAFVFISALFYFLFDSKRIISYAVVLSPLSDDDDLFLLKRLRDAINSILLGNLAVALIQGTQVGIGFAIFGVPNALLWGTVASFTALIPGVGTALITVPGIIYLFLSGHTGGAIGMLIWAACAVGSVDNFLGPRIMGRGVVLHPLVMLLSVLGGLIIFGPIGFLVGPLILSTFFTLLEIYQR